jgi:putative membrane protein
MAERDFLQDDGKRRVRDVIRRIERGTSAEIVVSVHKRSGSGRHVDYLVGFVFAMAMLGVLLFHPEPFTVDTMPLDVLAAFVAGAVISAAAAPLQRRLSSRARLARDVAVGARAAFVELGVSRTRDRTGILVFVSLFERRVEVVADIGLDDPGDAIASAFERLRASAAEARVDVFLQALEGLAEPLAAKLPRRDDDANEIEDEMRVA